MVSVSIVTVVLVFDPVTDKRMRPIRNRTKEPQNTNGIAMNIYPK